MQEVLGVELSAFRRTFAAGKLIAPSLLLNYSRCSGKMSLCGEHDRLLQLVLIFPSLSARRKIACANQVRDAVKISCLLENLGLGTKAGTGALRLTGSR